MYFVNLFQLMPYWKERMIEEEFSALFPKSFFLAYGKFYIVTVL